MTNQAPELVTTAQAAKTLGVSVWTVLRLARSGRLVAVHKLPGRTGALLFDASAVAELAPMARFKVGLTAGRPEETEIDRVVRAQGLVVSRDRLPGASWWKADA